MYDFVQKVNEVQKELLSQGLNYKITDICKLAASMPAPQFYIDAQTALKQYMLYQKGCSRIRNILKRKMYAEIFVRYEQIINALVNTGQIVRKYEVMEKVLKQPAPSFYYKDNSALKMYYYIMGKKRRYKR